MTFNIYINQKKALEWGINANLALVFSFVHDLPTWADATQLIEGGETQTWYHLSKGKIVEQLPILTDKPDTAWRYLKSLVAAGLIEMTVIKNLTHVRVTDKGKEWNRVPVAEPAQPKRKSPKVRKNNKGSEKSPTLGNESAKRKKTPQPEGNPGGVGNSSEPGSDNFPTDNSYQNNSYQDNSNSKAVSGETTRPPAIPYDRIIEAWNKTIEAENLPWAHARRTKERDQAIKARIGQVLDWLTANGKDTTPETQAKWFKWLFHLMAKDDFYSARKTGYPLSFTQFIAAKYFTEVFDRVVLTGPRATPQPQPLSDRDRVRKSLQDIHNTDWGGSGSSGRVFEHDSEGQGV